MPQIFKKLKYYNDDNSIDNVIDTLREHYNSKFKRVRSSDNKSFWGSELWCFPYQDRKTKKFNIRIKYTDEDMWNNFSNTKNAYLHYLSTDVYIDQYEDFIPYLLYGLQENKENPEILDKVKIYLKTKYNLNLGVVKLDYRLKKVKLYKKLGRYFIRASQVISNYIIDSESDDMYNKIDDMILYENITLEMSGYDVSEENFYD